MGKTTGLQRSRHAFFLLHVHLVFVAKYRGKVFDDDAHERLRKYFRIVCTDTEANLVECNGKQDHVHLLVRYPPRTSVSKLVNALKGVSSRRLRTERPDMQRHWGSDTALWSPSYFAASCGGAPIAVLRRYIEAQAEAASSPS